MTAGSKHPLGLADSVQSTSHDVSSLSNIWHGHHSHFPDENNRGTEMMSLAGVGSQVCLSRATLRPLRVMLQPAHLKSWNHYDREQNTPSSLWAGLLLSLSLLPQSSGNENPLCWVACGVRKHCPRGWPRRYKGLGPRDLLGAGRAKNDTALPWVSSVLVGIRTPPKQLQGILCSYSLVLIGRTRKLTMGPITKPGSKPSFA